MDNSLRMLGLAKKAGFLVAGDESVFTASRLGKTRAIFSASDASDASKRHAVRYAGDFGAVYAVLPYTKAELGAVIGRGTPGMLAVLDTGLAAGFVQKLAEANPDMYGEAAKKLGKRSERAQRRKKEASAGSNTGKRRTAR